MLEFLLEKETLIRETLLENSQRKPVKVQLSVKLILQKPIEEDTEKIEVHLNTDMIPVFAQGLAKETFFEMIDKLLSTLFSFTAHGSLWTVDKIKTVESKTANFAPVRGSSDLALPSELQGVRSLLNIRNHLDNKCFLYCFTAAYHLFYGPPLQTDTWRTVTSPPLYSSNNPSAHQAIGDFDMPMGFKDMANFEILNNVQVNVFRYENKQPFPLRLSKNYDFEFTLDVLLLQDDQIYHYVFITNILSLVNHIKQRRPRSDDKLCRNCFHICSQESYINHHNNCVKFEAAAIEMPASNADEVEFKNFNARAYAPVVIYFDLESLIIPIQSCDDNPSSSWTRTLEKLTPCGFCLVLIESGSLQPVHVSIDRSSTCMQKLAIHLQTIAREIYQRKQTHRRYKGRPDFSSDQVTDCWICEQPFLDELKVLDHCHYTGKYLGYAHDQCNLKRRSINYIPVIAHNSSNYDIHHLCKNLHEFESQCKIELVPVTNEKYITVNIGVRVNSYTDKRGVVKNVYEYLRYIDSYRFLPSSLEKLVSYLPTESFQILDNYFQNHQPIERELLHRKGFYPYSYFDSFE